MPRIGMPLGRRKKKSVPMGKDSQRQVGGIEGEELVVKGLLKQHLDKLYSLASNADGAASGVDMDVTTEKKMLKVLQSSQDSLIQEILKVFIHITTDRHNESIVRQNVDMIRSVVVHMRSENIKVIQLAVWTVTNLCINADNHSVLKQTDGFEILVDCLLVEDVETVKHTLDALVSAAREITVYIQSQHMERLVSLVQSLHASGPEMTRKALFLLYEASSNVDLIDGMIDRGTFSLCMELLPNEMVVNDVLPLLLRILLYAPDLIAPFLESAGFSGIINVIQREQDVNILGDCVLIILAVAQGVISSGILDFEHPDVVEQLVGMLCVGIGGPSTLVDTFHSPDKQLEQEAAEEILPLLAKTLAALLKISPSHVERYVALKGVGRTVHLLYKYAKDEELLNEVAVLLTTILDLCIGTVEEAEYKVEMLQHGVLFPVLKMINQTKGKILENALSLFAHLAAVQRENLQVIYENLESTSTMRTLVGMLRVGVRETALRMRVMMAVASILRDERSHDAFVELGGCEAVVPLLLDENSLVQINAITAVYYLTLVFDGSRCELIRLGGLDSILTVLLTPDAPVLAMIEAMKAVANMCVTEREESLFLIVQSGCALVLINFLSLEVDESDMSMLELKEYASFALESLCYSELARSQLLEDSSKGLASIVELVSHPSPFVQVQAAHILFVLSIDADIRELFCVVHDGLSLISSVCAECAEVVDSVPEHDPRRQWYETLLVTANSTLHAMAFPFDDGVEGRTFLNIPDLPYPEGVEPHVLIERLEMLDGTINGVAATTGSILQMDDGSGIVPPPSYHIKADEPGTPVPRKRKKKRKKKGGNAYDRFEDDGEGLPSSNYSTRINMGTSEAMLGEAGKKVGGGLKGQIATKGGSLIATITPLAVKEKLLGPSIDKEALEGMYTAEDDDTLVSMPGKDEALPAAHSPRALSKVESVGVLGTVSCRTDLSNTVGSEVRFSDSTGKMEVHVDTPVVESEEGDESPAVEEAEKAVPDVVVAPPRKKRKKPVKRKAPVKRKKPVKGKGKKRRKKVEVPVTKKERKKVEKKKKSQREVKKKKKSQRSIKEGEKNSKFSGLIRRKSKKEVVEAPKNVVESSDTSTDDERALGPALVAVPPLPIHAIRPALDVEVAEEQEEEDIAELLHISAGIPRVDSKTLHATMIDTGNISVLPLDSLLETRAQVFDMLDTRRYKLVERLKQAELSFFLCMRNAIRKFRDPLAVLARSPEPPILDESVERIFVNMDQLYLMAGLLLGGLTLRTSNWFSETCIGDLFLYLPSFVQSYIDYAVFYADAKAALKASWNEHIAFLFALDSGPAFSYVMKLLALPAQHLRLYAELLRELLSWTPKDHPDFKFLCSAVSILAEGEAEVGDVLQSEASTGRGTNTPKLELMRSLDVSVEAEVPPLLEFPACRITEEGNLDGFLAVYDNAIVMRVPPARANAVGIEWALPLEAIEEVGEAVENEYIVNIQTGDQDEDFLILLKSLVDKERLMDAIVAQAPSEVGSTIIQ